MIALILENSLSQALTPVACFVLAARHVTVASAAGGPLVFWLLIALGGIAAVCGGLYLAHHRWDRYRHQSHAALFRGLCEVQGLDAAQRRLLAQVARHHRLPEPARLFTEPQWLDPVCLEGPLEARAAEFSLLRARLFAVEDAKR